jgi:hypothetical protein
MKRRPRYECDEFGVKIAFRRVRRARSASVITTTASGAKILLPPATVDERRALSCPRDRRSAWFRADWTLVDCCGHVDSLWATAIPPPFRNVSTCVSFLISVKRGSLTRGAGVRGSGARASGRA